MTAQVMPFLLQKKTEEKKSKWNVAMLFEQPASVPHYKDLVCILITLNTIEHLEI